MIIIECTFSILVTITFMYLGEFIHPDAICSTQEGNCVPVVAWTEIYRELVYETKTN
jgi:hypothetical protein